MKNMNIFDSEEQLQLRSAATQYVNFNYVSYKISDRLINFRPIPFTSKVTIWCLLCYLITGIKGDGTWKLLAMHKSNTN